MNFSKILFALFLSFIISGQYAFAQKEVFIPKPVVVTFYQKDCEECDNLNVIKQKMIEEYGKDINFVKINFLDDDCDLEKLKEKYNIKSAPTTLFLNAKYGITKKTAGYIPEKLYRKQIEAISQQ